MAKRAKKQSFEEKNPEFVSEVVGMSVPDLNKRISTLAKQVREVEEAEKDDNALQSAKAEVKEMKAPYSDSKKDLKNRMHYVIKLVKEKGGE